MDIPLDNCTSIQGVQTSLLPLPVPAGYFIILSLTSLRLHNVLGR